MKIGNHIYLEEFFELLNNRRELELDAEQIKAINESAEAVQEYAKNRIAIYGITTGFGEKINTLITPDLAEKLQHNLILTHATGIGNPLSVQEVRAIMLCRLITLVKGKSGVRLGTIQLLMQFLKSSLVPYVPEQGSLGASGDLAPLAHIACALIGKGKVIEIFKKETVSIWSLPDDVDAIRSLIDPSVAYPLTLTYKEGLALINGTAGMTGIAMLNLQVAKKIIYYSLIATGLSLNALMASSKPFDLVGIKLKGHYAGLLVARFMNELLKDCDLIRDQEGIVGRLSPQISGRESGTIEVAEYLQNAYSLRCIPQVVGMVLQTYFDTEKVVLTELNGLDDNPILTGPYTKDGKNVFHGANFHGQFVANYMDYLKIAIIQLAKLSERRIARLIDSKYNSGLPDLLAPKNSGLQCALEGLQYTATSLVGEMCMMSHPGSIQSIPSNLNNQDLVSMGMISARSCRDVLDMALKVITVELIVSSHALELRREIIISAPFNTIIANDDQEATIKKFGDLEYMNETLNRIHAHVLERFPVLYEDRWIADNFESLLKDIKEDKELVNEELEALLFRTKKYIVLDD